jgi:hypothetical protein
MTKPAKLLIEHTYRTPVGQLAQPKGEWWGWSVISMVCAGILFCQLSHVVFFVFGIR